MEKLLKKIKTEKQLEDALLTSSVLFSTVFAIFQAVAASRYPILISSFDLFFTGDDDDDDDAEDDDEDDDDDDKDYGNNHNDDNDDPANGDAFD